MNKWGYALMSVGCVIIASAPLTNQSTMMIIGGCLVVLIGILMARKKEKL